MVEHQLRRGVDWNRPRAAELFSYFLVLLGNVDIAFFLQRMVGLTLHCWLPSVRLPSTVVASVHHSIIQIFSIFTFRSGNYAELACNLGSGVAIVQ